MKLRDVILVATIASWGVACRHASTSAETSPRPVAREVPPPANVFRDLVMTPADCKTPPRVSISRDEANADAAVVERIVRRGWAGFETMKKEGVDFDAVFASLARSIGEAREPIRVEAFQDLLVRALRPAADSHMAFFEYTAKGHAKRKSVGRQVQAYTTDLVVLANGDAIVLGIAPRPARVLDCSGAQVAFRPTVTTVAGVLTPATRPIVLDESRPEPLRCRFRLEDGSTSDLQLPMRRVRPPFGTKHESSAPAFEHTSGPIPILTLRTFWTGKESELASFVATAAKLRDAKAIVVDVRGNGGGSDSYAKQWFADLTSGTLKGSMVDRLDSEVTRQGIVNDNECQITEGLDDPAALREANERLAWGRKVVSEAEAGGTPIHVWKPRRTDTQGRAPSPFRAPLVALIDNGCASACESFISHVRQVEGGIVVGENSGGVGVFGEVLVYRLPNSGLGMSAAMKYFHDPDPAREVPEGRGHLPDYWIDSDDPSIDAMRIAECLAQPSCPLRRK